MTVENLFEIIDPISLLLLVVIAGIALAVLRFVFKVTMKVLRIGCIAGVIIILAMVGLSALFPPIQ
ncbi:MAG: hypothetical protein DWQ07_11810 [Chloroflexi bacterium]|nr:MAG: hypothetical protein DWQ07_11810 [Chloroflexota bacterium]MBL1197469.1 hypothetical protein [Chloroflexota bacterium]NOH14764.1 hypothetical protein [Chloroflexota bacterium]